MCRLIDFNFCSNAIKTSTLSPITSSTHSTKIKYLDGDVDNGEVGINEKNETNSTTSNNSNNTIILSTVLVTLFVVIIIGIGGFFGYKYYKDGGFNKSRANDQGEGDNELSIINPTRPSNFYVG